MKVAVVGAGSMGSLFASYFPVAFEEVWVYDVWREHVDAIRTGGLIRRRGSEEQVIRLNATSRPEDVGVADLVLVFVKGTHTRQAAEDARCMAGDNTWVLTLQNGIGNVEILEAVFPRDHIIFGLTTLPSDMEGPGRIHDVACGEGRTYIWPLTGMAEGMPEEVVHRFRQSGIRCELAPDIETHIWTKLAVNCSYAALCAITKRKVGVLIASPEAQELVGKIIAEVVEVGRARGLDLDLDEVTTFVQRTAEEGRNHIPSLLGDVLAGRRTEIECLSGAVVRTARELGLAVPANDAVYKLIRAIEDSYADAL